MKAILAAALLAAGAFPCLSLSLQDAPPSPTFYGLLGREERVMFLGEAKLTDGEAVITLPADFEQIALPDGRTLQLTCCDGWSALSAGKISNGKFTVSTDQTGNKAQSFWWEVKAIMSSAPPK